MYKIAKMKGYLTSRTWDDSKAREKLHLTVFFDMISGTSIGGIIACAMAKPKEIGSLEPGYYSDDCIEIGTNMADFSFKPVNAFKWWMMFLTILGGVVLGGGGTYMWIRCTEQNDIDLMDNSEKMAKKFIEK